MAAANTQKIKVRIVENSFQARLATKYMHSSNVALVLGNRIHLWGVNRPDFLLNKKWLRHELMHIEQFKKYGYLKFLYLYVFETMRHGYFKNRFEAEARTAENMDMNMELYEIQ